jgi:hypothetical protein
MNALAGQASYADSGRLSLHPFGYAQGSSIREPMLRNRFEWLLIYSITKSNNQKNKLDDNAINNIASGWAMAAIYSSNLLS